MAKIESLTRKMWDYWRRAVEWRVFTFTPSNKKILR